MHETRPSPATIIIGFVWLVESTEAAFFANSNFNHSLKIEESSQIK